jgi:hypothetical protein
MMKCVKGGMSMYRISPAILVFFVALAACLLLPCGAARGQAITLGANDQAGGATISFSNPGPNSYFRLSFVDPRVNRLRIVNDRNFIFFDGHPEAGNEIFLPVGSYTSTVWSGYGTSPAAAIIGGFFNIPKAQPPAASQAPSQSQAGQRTDYGFVPATDPAPSLPYVQYAPDYYGNYYNNYYPPYYFNRYNPPPINQPVIQSRPSSVTDPAYIRQQYQNSVTNPDYMRQQQQNTVIPPIMR